jgi:type VI secretion system protein ImpA
MSVSLEFDALRAPIVGDKPSGLDLEDSAALGRLNALRVFGRDSAWDQQPNWAEIRDETLAILATSKDLRILALLAAASLRTDDLAIFCGLLDVAADWVDQYWESLYPGLDDEGLFRRNALACFADRVAVIEGIRRVWLVASRQHGRFSLRDIDFARGIVPAPPDATTPQEAEIAAAFADIKLDELLAAITAVESALGAIKRIEVKTTAAVGPGATPNLEPLSKTLGRIQDILREYCDSHPAARESAAQNAADDRLASRSGMNLAVVRSRQDAVRALDAVARFFLENEPSSPIPMFVERAKRLVAKNFLEILEDVVPDAVTQARNVGGIRE